MLSLFHCYQFYPHNRSLGCSAMFPNCRLLSPSAPQTNLNHFLVFATRSLRWMVLCEIKGLSRWLPICAVNVQYFLSVFYFWGMNIIFSLKSLCNFLSSQHTHCHCCTLTWLYNCHKHWLGALCEMKANESLNLAPTMHTPLMNEPFYDFFGDAFSHHFVNILLFIFSSAP